MTELNTIRDIAREALIVSANGTDKDHSLWDCAQRLARSTEHICKLPELSRLTTQIDMFCLITAAYFSNAAFAGMQKETPAQNDNDAIAAICTRAVSDKLGGILDPIAVKRVNRIITESFSRSTSMPEAMILSDARNLEDIGTVGLFNEIKRYSAAGKGISDVLNIWRRKTEYQYWQARLKESFIFESVRKIAERRLAEAEQLLSRLNIENAASDIQ